jgi:hypothetical protein
VTGAVGTRGRGRPATAAGSHPRQRLVQHAPDGRGVAPVPVVGVVLAGQALAGLGDQLHPLVVAGEGVLGDRPLMDHAGLQAGVGGQPRVDHRRVGVNLAGDRALAGRRGRWAGRGVGRQVLLHGEPVQVDLVRDFTPGRADGAQWLVARRSIHASTGRTRGGPPILSAWRLTSRRVVTPGRIDGRLAGTSTTDHLVRRPTHEPVRGHQAATGV